MVTAVSSVPSPREREAVRRVECLHCRLPLARGERSAFCCRGCEAVYELLTERGLSRYYDLGGGDGHPVAPASSEQKWLEPIVASLAARPAGLSRIVLDVQGLHCSACVWLLDELFRREPSGAGIVVNPTVGSVELTIGPGFPLASYVSAIEAFGYRFGPPLKASGERTASSAIVWRMGVCIAIAMNTMIFGFAIYCGLSEGRLFRLFHALDFALSFVSVVVGGSVFFRSAWQAVRRRVLHLDLPIALGIALVFTSSTYTYLTRGGGSSYFDTLNVFIALMLVGRFLQERVLAKNRAYLLASEGAEGLYTRRVAGSVVSLVRCTEIAEGDVLLVGHQDLVPVDAELLGSDPAVFSLDWINGESAPRAFAPGDVVPGGAFCQDSSAATLRATSAFDASAVDALLRTSHRRDDDLARATPWWKRLTSIYVVSVLVIALGTFAGWLLVTHDLPRTLDVVAAVLIVTCPCAFGIATPLAYELAQASLRRVGLFVRTPGFLDRAAETRRVVFDKTGTLTTGSLTVADRGSLARLDDHARALCYAMAVRSSHPKSRAVARAVEELGVPGAFDARQRVSEVAGKGLETADGAHTWRLGAPGWATTETSDADVVLSRDGAAVAEIRTVEEARPGAREEVLALAQEGYEICVLSGDSPEATRAMAATCGVPAERAFGARTPEGKASWLRQLEARSAKKTLFVGDGINDSLVAEEADCAGTPAIDRPFMAARCDFYFVSPGLAPIREALHMAKRLARVVHVNLAIAVLYNLVTVTLAVAGLMTPLWCAVLMPLSSLSTVLATTVQLTRRKRRPAWTS
ncbi:MAG TPA: heavy metal translocating P-type ATPase metal-binding domain-containing protein [Labilithrix sp.]|nr:heavy metal translocating P-type ATPase metal-binding domain-containing protein [Labilithrix sp.]